MSSTSRSGSVRSIIINCVVDGNDGLGLAIAPDNMHDRLGSCAYVNRATLVCAT